MVERSAWGFCVARNALDSQLGKAIRESTVSHVDEKTEVT